MRSDNRFAAVILLTASFFLIFLSTHISTDWRAAPGGAGGAEGSGRVVGTGQAGGGGHPTAEASGKKYSFPGLPLDLNTATRAELMRLPGIGGKTADRIIEERARRDGFREVTDLLDIEWLGNSRLSRLRGLVHVKVIEEKVPAPGVPPGGLTP
jgi:hypothetical protein